MISVKEVEEIHNILIDTFGGAHGIRFDGFGISLSQAVSNF